MERSSNTEPTLKQKLISGANWGMLAGFWVELPILITSTFKAVNISKWSARLVLPATLLGVVYGFTKPMREQRKAEAALERGEEPAPEPTLPPTAQGKWTAAEKTRGDQPLEMARQ